MPVIAVAADDPRVADYRDLTDMAWRMRMEPEQGLFLAEGEKVILRALAAGYQPRSALMTEKWLPGLQAALSSFDIDVMVASETVLRGVVGFRLHRGALAAFHRKQAPALADILAQAETLVVLEDLVDHTNVGLIMRTAAAVGIDAAVVSPRCADPYYRRSVKTSMGAVLALPWTTAPTWPGALQEIVEAGFTVMALTPEAGAGDLGQWQRGDRKVALLLGTEGDGLSPAAMAAATAQVRIPVTSRVDSLNVAAAAAIACYEVVARVRECRGHQPSAIG